MKLISLFISILLLTGCTTIHFDNGEEVQGIAAADKWHHNFFFDLYEASAPVNLETECADREWSSVKTELTFLNVLARSAVNWLAPIWYPKVVETTCKKKEEPNNLVMKTNS